MLSEPLTLYKLMILYMLKQVKFPLSLSQFCDFFLEKEYTNYFTVQQALAELLSANLIRVETARNSSRYELTRDGEETLSFFGKNISAAIIADMDQFLSDNKIRLRNEVGTTADYYKTPNQEYMVHCQVREGKNILVEINVATATKELAELMCDHWQDSSQKIYETIVKELMKD